MVSGRRSSHKSNIGQRCFKGCCCPRLFVAGIIYKGHAKKRYLSRTLNSPFANHPLSLGLRRRFSFDTEVAYLRGKPIQLIKEIKNQLVSIQLALRILIFREVCLGVGHEGYMDMYIVSLSLQSTPSNRTTTHLIYYFLFFSASDQTHPLIFRFSNFHLQHKF